MATRDKIQFFLRVIAANEQRLSANHKLLDIYQGNLLPYVQEALQRQLSGQSYKAAADRIPPINVLKRIIEKLSRIYSEPPVRLATGDDDAQEVMGWYVKTMGLDSRMAIANCYFNLFKNCLIEPHLNRKNEPCLRIIPSDRFVPYCEDQKDDDYVSGFILVIGHKTKTYQAPGKKDTETKIVMVYKAVDSESFCYFDSDGVDVTAEYSPENPQGVNPLGRVPYVYLNREPNSIQPTIDTDTYAMTILIPILLTDINFAHMFQAFSILYGINVTDQGLVFSPSAFWSFKTEPGSDQKPEVGSIKPNADIQAGLELVASQLSFWLNTRGIKPGAVGDITAQNFQSGISKIVDEMDTSEDRKSQVPYFKEAEEKDLWDLILNVLHPIWRGVEGFGETQVLANKVEVQVAFHEQIPLMKRGEVVKDQVEEIIAGLTTRKLAIQRINPNMTGEEVEDLLAEIDEERTIEVETPEEKRPIQEGQAS